MSIESDNRYLLPFHPLTESLEAAEQWLDRSGETGGSGGADEHLICFAQLYVDTKNPIFAWQAFAWVGSNSDRIPSWIMTFLADQAGAVIRLANEKSFDSDKCLARLPTEMGFTSPGAGSAFSEYRDGNAHAKVARAFSELIAAGHKQKNARELLANAIGKKSGATVKTYTEKAVESWERQQAAINKAKTK